MIIFPLEKLPKLKIIGTVKFICKDTVPAVAYVYHQPTPVMAPITIPTTIAAATASTIILITRGFLSCFIAILRSGHFLLFYHIKGEKSTVYCDEKQNMNLIILYVQTTAKPVLCKTTKFIDELPKIIAYY